MSPRQWILSPHDGGSKISKELQAGTIKAIQAYAEKHYKGKYIRIEVAFKGKFCYIDAYQEPDLSMKTWKITKETKEEFVERLRNTPTHLCRLRYFEGLRQWSMAFYTYSNEKYVPSMFHTGQMFGTPEEAFETSAVYLRN
jgi:hypothetical protein